LLDGLFFKVLAHNDTGKAAGHQGGIVIPKDLAKFFPPVAKGLGPTDDIRLWAALHVDGQYLATVDTRYQHQTWGGTRSPERRLTDNLGLLRNQASSGDILLFRKSLDNEGQIDLFLVTKSVPFHQVLLSQVNGRRWGVLDPANPPITQDEFKDASEEIEAQSLLAPTIFMNSRNFEFSRTKRRARDHAFRSKVISSYDRKCTITSRRFEVPKFGHLGLDAAHIVPVSAGGSDDPANGISLTKELHWAFDRGLIGIDSKRQVIVPTSVCNLSGNEFLRDLQGRQINEAVMPRSRALDEAFEWHRNNVLVKNS
jgi:putative restriction endonuclease